MQFYGIFKPCQSFLILSGQALGQMVTCICLFRIILVVLRSCIPGRNKLIINHLGRLFVTSDAATIIREVEVVHPAAKLLVMASQAQETEVRIYHPLELNILTSTRGS